MSTTLNIQEFELLRTLIEDECGIAVDDQKVYLIESRLAKLMVECGCENYGEFYLKAKTPAETALREKIVDAMTTNETLWFRDTRPFMALREHLFPKFIQEIKDGKRNQLKIWSAACSSGQEPYSMVMIANELARLAQGGEHLLNKMSILATDISPSVLMLAKMGRYDGIAMSRGLPDEMKTRYFEEKGRVWEIKPDIKKPVTFQKLNLMDSFGTLPKFDLIMLRNVAIYFSAEAKKELFAKIAAQLNPDGILFIGSSETLMGYSQAFAMQEYQKCIYYQLKP